MYKSILKSIRFICILAGIAVLGTSFYKAFSGTIWWEGMLFFLLLTAVSRKSDFVFPSGSSLKIYTAITMLSIYIVGPYITTINELFVVIIDRYKDLKGNLQQVLIDSVVKVISIFVSGVLYIEIGRRYNYSITSSIYSLFPLFISTWLYLFSRSILSTLLSNTFFRRQILGKLLIDIKSFYRDFVGIYFSLILLLGTFVYGNLFGLVVFMVIYLLARLSFKQYLNLKESYFSIIGVLANAIDAKDTYTRGHSERVTIYALAIAREMNLGDRQIEILKNAALLHDVGKIGISEKILDKPKELTDDESIIMKKHPIIGEKMLSQIKFLTDMGHIVRGHHEKYDGTGYPDGLKGDEIPLLSRIIAVADTFDAMVLSRPYRKARSVKEAINEIRRTAGTQLDPNVAVAFLAALDKGDIKIPMEYSLEMQAFEQLYQIDNMLNV